MAGAQDQRKTQENGSTNKLTSTCVCFSHLHGFFPSPVEGRHSAVTNLGFAIKLNSESPLATGSINEGYGNGLKDDLKKSMQKYKLSFFF